MRPLGGNFTKSFEDSIQSFCKIISSTGATPYLYLTWGRKDGDKRNPSIYPTYSSMQKKLSKAYEKAARKNKAKILPVGYAYQEINRRNKTVFKSLYKKDGSHPSINGAFLVSCVFWGSLTKDDPTTINPIEGVDEAVAQQLQKFAKNAIDKNKLK